MSFEKRKKSPFVGWKEALTARSAKNVSCRRSPPGMRTMWICRVSPKRVPISISRRTGCQLSNVAVRTSV
jgi:hypothetical protein